MVRTPQALVPYTLAIGCLLAGWLWHAGDQVAGLGRSVQSGQADIGGPFTLIDQNGKSRTPADFRGRYMLIYFGYSFCPDVCPTTLAVMAQGLAKLGAQSSRVVPVFISIDPARDTPAVLKPYMKSFGDNFVGLTGSPKMVSEAARFYHVYIAKRPIAGGGYSMDHSSVLYLMGPDGRFVTYYEETLGPDGLADALRARL